MSQGFCINSVAACLIWRSPKDFNPSNWLVLTMIFYSISILPFSAMWHKNMTWEYGNIMCRTQAHLRSGSLSLLKVLQEHKRKIIKIIYLRHINRLRLEDYLGCKNQNKRWWLSFVISHFCCFGLFVVYLRRLQNYFTQGMKFVIFFCFMKSPCQL